MSDSAMTDTLSRLAEVLESRKGAAADSSVSFLAEAAKSSGTKKTVRAISDGVAGDSFMRRNVEPRGCALLRSPA